MIVKNLLLHMYSDQMHNYYGALNIIYCTEEVGVAGIYLLTRRNSTRIYVCKLFSSSSGSRYVVALQWWCAILQASKKLPEVGDCFRLLLMATGYRGNYCNDWLAQPPTPPTAARHWLLVLLSDDITVWCERRIDGGYDGGRCKQPHSESWGQLLG